MTYAALIEELSGMPNVKVNVIVKNGLQLAHIGLSKGFVHALFIPDPNDQIDEIILHQTLSRINASELFPLYSVM